MSHQNPEQGGIHDYEALTRGEQLPGDTQRYYRLLSGVISTRPVSVLGPPYISGLSARAIETYLRTREVPTR